MERFYIEIDGKPLLTHDIYNNEIILLFKAEKEAEYDSRYYARNLASEHKIEIKSMEVYIDIHKNL